jgi:hypothetical protein
MLTRGRRSRSLTEATESRGHTEEQGMGGSQRSLQILSEFLRGTVFSM